MPGKILVVDDVATNRIILQVKLAAACYEVIQAADGAAALEVAAEAKPDLILLDIAMPEMDGVEVCRRLKSDPLTADIPVVIVTAHNNSIQRLAALSAGAEDFLAKPIDDVILLARLRSLLRARATAEELSLREGSAEVFGFCDAAGPEFAPRGRIALLADTAEHAVQWREGLRRHLPHRIDVTVPMRVLRDGSEELESDVFVIAEPMLRPGDGLQLLSELRARTATRHAAIILIMTSGARDQAAMALDLGASDLMLTPFDTEELALRIGTQMARKRQADALRAQIKSGMRLAVTDPLTEIYNRRYGLSHLARVHERAARRGNSYGLMLIDLDRFKDVNDSHGHAAGDAVLQTVVGRLSQALRSVDLISRIGGEEFLVVMPDMSETTARAAADRLREVVEAEPISLPNGTKIHQTVSIGVAIGCGPEPERSWRDVMHSADRALYGAKGAGRNRTMFGNGHRSAA